MHINIVFLMNCDLPWLEIQDSYEKRYCEYVAFHFLWLYFQVL